MTTVDALRLVGIGVLLVDIGMMLWIMRRALWFRPVGWILIIWGLLNTGFNSLLFLDSYTDVVTNETFNKISQGLRLETSLSVFAILVIIIFEVRRDRK